MCVPGVVPEFGRYSAIAVSSALMATTFVLVSNVNRKSINRQMRNQPLHPYLPFVGAVLLAAVIGFGSFIFYQGFSTQAVTGSSLVLLAIAAGVASLFSPCSFPLLVTLLAREVSDQSKRTLVQTGAAFTFGVILFLTLLGAALALGAGSAVSQFTFTSATGRLLRGFVGIILIGFGVWQLKGKSLNFGWLNRLLTPLWTEQARMRRRRSSLSYGLYGFGYILAGFG